MKGRVILVALLFLAALAGALYAPELVLSPNRLLKGHAKIAGDCFACHSPLRGPSGAKCMRCHKPAEIRTRKPGGVPFHRMLVEKDCLSCHTDHVGPMAAKATRAFNHDLLVPATRTLCQDCHTKPADALHRVITKGCNSCHTQKAWKPATFDHARYFRFDRHHRPVCANCHVGEDYRQYTCYEGCHKHTEAKIRREHLKEGIRDFSECTECHRSGDEHEAERIWRQKRRALPGDGGRQGGRRERDDD